MIEKREKIIELEEKERIKEEKEKKRREDNEKVSRKKSPIFDLQGMLNDFKKKEEKNISNIKQRQKNEIFQQMETRIKNTIIKVKILIEMPKKQ